MTDEDLSLQERVDRHLDRHPDAGVPAIAGALDESPAAVAEVLDETTPESGQESNSRFRDRLRGSPSRLEADLDGRWSKADFQAPESGIYPPGMVEREQWMGHAEKKPFAPWGDADAPAPCSKDGHDTAATCECDARYKWGYEGHYRDGETAAMAEVDPRLDGLAYIQLPDDPYLYVDGDDVRDPETGAVHPAFVAILDHLGLTFADISQSGAGAHAIYHGDLPADVKQASWRLDDEPWGDNDDLPSIEIYPGKRVCVMTGAHVPGTPTEVRDLNEGVLQPLLEANDQFPSSHGDDGESPSTDREDYDIEDHQPEATTASETTSDIRDVFYALDRLDAQRVAEKTIVHRWNEDASTSEGERAFAPTWGPNSNGTANIVNSQRWQDTGDRGGYGGPVAMAAIDADHIDVDERVQGGVSGETWWRAVEHLRGLGFDIPEYESDSSADDRRDARDDAHPLVDVAAGEDADVDPGAESVVPLAQLEALPHDERRRAARKRGLDWPTTDEARDRLLETIKQAMRNEDDTVVDAPTSLGKSYSVATTRWDVFDDTTGGKPVVHLAATRDARDEIAEAAAEEGGDHFVLLSRHEACPVAAGDHDPREVRESGADRQVITMDGEPASQWLDRQCEGKGLPFSVAHQHLAEHNDQGATLPCCRGEATTYDEDVGDFDDGERAECPAIRQWDDLREGDYPLVIATHNFAHVPRLRTHTNVVVDEEPDFETDLSKERIERAITAYLQAADAPVATWEGFISLVQHDGWQGDAARERDQLQSCLDYEPDREWYLKEDDAHTLAPALARAIFHAEDRGNGRRTGKTPHEPPRLDAHASDEDGWNRVWVTVTLDEDNDVRTVRTAPDLSQARSVIGLDAHPAEPVWSVNTVPHINTTQVLEPEERRLWRRYERGLRVVQVGDATRPLASGEYWNEGQVEALAAQLREEYGADFRTAISTASVEPQLQDVLEDVGASAPETMHYGEEKSRNDFADEGVGLIEGCVDPGDDYVLDLLAELDLDARPETTDVDGEQRRAHGRGFEGPDAETARAILASVRENHTAQAAGRYARNPDDPESHATVYVRTDAMPADFADVQVAGVEWVFTELQREIVRELRKTPGRLSARDLADAVDCSKAHVRDVLKRLEEMGTVQAFAGAGDHGATLYAESGLPNAGVVDLDDQIANGGVRGTYTWSLAIREPATPVDIDETPTTRSEGEVWDWQTATDGGGPPD